MMATFVDHYAVLGIKSTADSAVVKRAYRQLALLYHPDKAEPGKRGDTADFIKAQAAYEILTDDAKRKDYDTQCKKRSNNAVNHRARQKNTPSRSFFSYPEAGGNYGAQSWRDDLDGDDVAMDQDCSGTEDNQSDASSDSSRPENQDCGVYSDGYSDPHYQPCHASQDVCIDGDFDDGSLYAEDYDASSSQYYFPSAYDDAPLSMDTCETAWGPDSEHGGDDIDLNPALRISHPVSDAYDMLAGHFARTRKSHYLEEKVSGRYFQGTILDLRAHKGECDTMDARLRDIASRLRCRTTGMPAGSVPLGELEASLSAKMGAAHSAVGYVRGVTDYSLEVMYKQHQPRFWQLMDKRTWSVIGLLERDADRLGEMRLLLSELEDIVQKMEALDNSELRSLKGYLRSFMSEMGNWQKTIMSKE